MTALAGVIGTAPTEPLRAICRAILAGQQQFQSAPPAVSATPGAAMGAGLFTLLPEDSGSESALASDDRFLIAADIRLDNRDELAGAAGIRPPLNELSDTQILLAAWDRFGEASLDRLVGDFAIAVFDKRKRLLTLARDPTGQRPLFYTQSDATAAFSSMPSGLLSHEGFRHGWNRGRLAATLLGIHDADPASYFAGIHHVLPGELVRVGSAGLERRIYWQPHFGKTLRLSLDEAAEEYRHLLGAAVKCRRRRRSGHVAAQLSCGYDSNGVAATAALECGSDQVVAFTAAPQKDCQTAVLRGRLADESAAAALTAEEHGIRHHIVHSRDFTLDYLRSQAMLCQDPARNHINNLWGSEILERAAEAQATVLLTGTYGNLTLNADALQALPDWLRRRGLRAWWHQAAAAAARDDVRWRGVLFNSFAPWLPHWAWAWLLTTFQGIERPNVHSFASAECLPDPRAGQPQRLQPPASPAEYRLQTMRNVNDGVFLKSSIAAAGIVELQPLADRRLVEFSLGLAPEHLIKDGEFRPVARRALSDRVPSEVLDLQLRGVQSADWHAHFRQKAALEILEEIEASHTVRQLIDIPKVRSAVSDWPPPEDYSVRTLVRYMRTLPNALAVGVFIREFEKSWKALPAHR